MKIYIRKGDAWTPPRFWKFRVFNNDQSYLIK